jgi:hypothetical protein
MKILCTIAALACGLALAAAPARASDRTIPFEVRLADRAVTCADSDFFGIPFDLASLGGKPLGTGQSCVHSIVGCDPLVPFCHQKVDATFTLAFARGTVTAPMTLHEVLPTESLTLQRGEGRISSGTGAFARARGSVEGGGFLEFTATGVSSALFYAVRLK